MPLVVLYVKCLICYHVNRGCDRTIISGDRTIIRKLIGNYDGDGNENGKKAIGLE